jgi:hypothetical protein
MQGNVTPVPDDAWALFAPWEAPLSREIIPMERLLIKFSPRPTRKMSYYVALRSKRAAARSVRRLRKAVLEVKARPNPYEKNASPILRDSKILSIQHCPLDPVAGHSVTT